MAAYSLAELLGSTSHLQPTPRQQGRERVASARSRNRAAAWAYDLAQWREYRLAMARDAGEREAIEIEYAARLEAGPDFCHYHSSSTYDPAPVNCIDRQGKREILTAFDQVRAWLWRNARKARGQAVSRIYREVLQVLLSFAVKYGAVFPSIATIAKLACCSERTVSNALQWLKTFGFLSWQRRLKRIPTVLGQVVRQTSNAYRLGLERLATIGAGVFGKKTDRNNCRASSFTTINLPLLGQGEAVSA